MSPAPRHVYHMRTHLFGLFLALCKYRQRACGGVRQRNDRWVMLLHENINNLPLPKDDTSK